MVISNSYCKFINKDFTSYFFAFSYFLTTIIHNPITIKNWSYFHTVFDCSDLSYKLMTYVCSIMAHEKVKNRTNAMQTYEGVDV